ncbi:DMT family transporter [Alkalilimnicola sp. S0819]|uniref:DMT family transporter n=1 Tax=Alkalilimnicola sp. S0819 TaxID=2613922 RepID=UPI0012616D9A|nr:DMT family transporter [Alkalilimnicola sp. S0819]KAB7622972.1 DMT family transporter [Alkalilimnicola sp. S0819]MPQ17080.1 EamA family transporter [Alkalilimnicola sp. S0819]
MSPQRRSMIELNISLSLLGLVPLFAKLLPLEAGGIIFYRCVFGGLALLAFLALRRTPLALRRPRDLGLVVLGGVFLSVHWVTYFQAVQVSTVAVGVTAVFTYPAITVLLEPLFKGRLPGLMDTALAVVALLGVALIVPAVDLGDATVQGVLWGVLSALLFATRNVIHRHWLRDYPPSQMMACQMLASVLILWPLAVSPAQIGGYSWLGLLVLGIGFTAVAHSLFVGSMRHLPAKSVALIASLQPAYGILAAVILLGEVPGGRTLLGAGIVLAVAMVEARRARA